LKISQQTLRNLEKMAKFVDDEWVNLLFWHPDPDDPDESKGYQDGQDGLEEFLEDFEWKFKFKASEEFVKTIYRFATPLAGVLSWLATHDYVVFETNKNRFFLFSKGASLIEIRWSDDIEELHESQIQDPEAKRQKPTSHQTTIGCKYTIAHIVKWIFNTGEITRGYDVLADNCKDFTRRLSWAMFQMRGEK